MNSVPLGRLDALEAEARVDGVVGRDDAALLELLRHGAVQLRVSWSEPAGGR